MKESNMNIKRTIVYVIVAAITLVAVLGVWFAVSKVNNTINTANWETYIFPLGNFGSKPFGKYC